MRARLALTLGAILATQGSGGALAGGAQAGSCTGSYAYQQARATLQRELSKYTACISGGDPRESCATAFYRLRAAQRDYEAAVQESRIVCN